MRLQNVISRFLRYNLWANERLTSCLMTLDQDVLYRKTGSSFGTIDLTLQHILAAQVFWHAIIAKGRINEFDPPVKTNAVDEVKEERQVQQESIGGYIAGHERCGVFNAHERSD